MDKSLLLAIVNSKMKGKRKIMVVSGLRLGRWGREAFIRGSILWIELEVWYWLFAGGRVFVAWCMRVWLAFSKFVGCRGRERD